MKDLCVSEVDESSYQDTKTQGDKKQILASVKGFLENYNSQVSSTERNLTSLELQRLLDDLSKESNPDSALDLCKNQEGLRSLIKDISFESNTKASIKENKLRILKNHIILKKVIMYKSVKNLRLNN